MIAQRLYIPEKKASDILNDLCSSGFICMLPDKVLFKYDPSSLDLENLVNEIARLYGQNLIEITNLIHSKIDKQAQQLGDAFKWQKDRE